MKREQITQDLVGRYFETDFHGRSRLTVQKHRDYLERFLELTGYSTDHDAYSRWIEHAFSTWGERTARNIALAASSRFLGWCERNGFIDKSPHRSVRLPRPERHEARAPFSQAEYEALLNQAGDSAMAWAIRLGWETGMAMADCCLLQWRCVDLNKGVIRIRRQKTKEPCIIPLSEAGEVLPQLAEWADAQSSTQWPNRPPDIQYVHTELAKDYLVQHRSGGSVLQLRFARIRDRAGLSKDKSFHNLRASFCSVLANGGMNLSAACKVTGHRNPQIFNDYVTGDAESLREQIERARKKI